MATRSQRKALTRVVRLSNGLTLWLCSHRQSCNATGLGLVVAAGSLCESEDERGLSHLLEHLAFRGGRRMSAAALAELRRRFGLRLGEQQNASTSFDRASYTLKLHESDREALEGGLRWLADVADGLRLRPRDVDAERRIVLEEMRARNDVSSRIHLEMLRRIAPALAARDPIGDEAVLQALTPEHVRRFHARWYTPDRAVLVMVGDASLAAMTRMARQAFADWCGSSPTPAPRPTVADLGPTRVIHVLDPEVELPRIRVVGVREAPLPTSRASIEDALIDETALWLLARRLSDSVPAARTSLSPLATGWRIVETSLAAKQGEVKPRLNDLAAALAAAASEPVSPAELSLARGQLQADARTLADSSWDCDRVLGELVALAASDARPPLAPAVRARVAKRLGERLRAAQLRERLRRLAPDRDRVVLVVAPDDRGVREDAALTRLFVRTGREAGRRRVARPRPRALQRLPKAPERRARSSGVSSRGVVDLELANGIQAHVLPMRDRRNLVHVAATFVGGRIEETNETLGLTAAATLAFARPTTATRDAREIRDLLAVRSVSLGCSPDEDVVTVEVSSSSGDLEWALRLLRELLCEPRVDADTLAHWRERIEGLDATRQPSVERVLATTTLGLLTGNDPRFRLLTGERARATHREGAQRWLRRLTRRAPVEVALAGDVDRGRAATLVERCFGTLAPRPFKIERFDSLRRLATPEGPVETRHHLAGNGDRAAVLVGWRATPWSRHQERLHLQLANDILSMRLHAEVRERRGLAYDVSSSYSPSRAYPEASLLSISFLSDPRTLATALRAAREVVERLVREGPTSTEMDAARRRLHAAATKARREPRFWARSLAEQLLRGRCWKEVHDGPRRILDARGDDVRATLARYVVDARRITVLCSPPDGQQA